MNRLKPVRCRACNAEIVFLRRSKPESDGTYRKAPVNWETVAPGDEVFDLSRHTSHFRTCPYADQFRKQPTAKNGKKTKSVPEPAGPQQLDMFGGAA